MKKIIFILLTLILSERSLATVYYVCGTNYWDGAPGASNNFFYTTSDCSAGGPTDPTFVNGDEIVIPLSSTLIVTGNLTINAAIKITVFGKFYMQENPGAGNLNLTSNTSTIELKTGSDIGCWDASPAPGAVTTCSNSDQVTIGTGGTSFTWKGGAIDALTSPNVLTNTGLPVELMFFRTSKGLTNISLSWATASELNFDYFDIEKSTDGVNFRSIGTVKGHGTASERQDYKLDDEKPLIGKNYYRLKSVDFDGYTEYFDVVMVDFDGLRNFSVYPNPADGVAFKAETNFTPAQNAFVTIYTANGKEVGRYQVIGDLSDLTMPVKLEAGWYYARFISSEFTAVSRFLVK